MQHQVRSEESKIKFTLSFIHLGMIGYGAAKAATIHIGKSLAAPDSGMPTNSSVLTIAPYVYILYYESDLSRRYINKREKEK